MPSKRYLCKGVPGFEKRDTVEILWDTCVRNRTRW